MQGLGESSSETEGVMVATRGWGSRSQGVTLLVSQPFNGHPLRGPQSHLHNTLWRLVSKGQSKPSARDTVRSVVCALLWLIPDSFVTLSPFPSLGLRQVSILISHGGSPPMRFVALVST